MKVEWKLNKSKLKRFIFDKYGIKVKKIKFVPKGEVTYVYFIETLKKEKFVVKIYPKGRYATQSSKILKTNLRIVFELYSKCNIKHIAYPILTKKDKLITKYQGKDLAIFNFIKGKEKGEDKFKGKELKSLIILFSQIHGKTNRLNLKGGLKEKFALNYSKHMIQSFKELEKGNFKNKYHGKLSKMILPEKEKLLKIHKNLKKLSNKLKKQKNKFVICHTDPHGGNLMINKKGEIFLLDWDDLKLAPREQDLWFHIWDKPKLVSKTYEKIIGKVKLNKDILYFYYQHRHLEDLTHLLIRILHENDTAKQNKIDLLDVKDYTSRWVNEVDKEIIKLSKIADIWNKEK